jgi:2-enoate reductase
VPPIKGLDKARTRSAIDAFLAPSGTGRKPLVIGGGVTGCEAALYLAQQGKEVMIVEKLSELMPLEEIGYKYTTGVLAHLVKQAGVKAMVKSEVVEATAGSATIRRGTALVEVEADTIILSIGLRPNRLVLDSLQGLVKESHVVGDCQSPGRILEAIREGDRIGRAV